MQPAIVAGEAVKFALSAVTNAVLFCSANLLLIGNLPIRLCMCRQNLPRRLHSGLLNSRACGERGDCCCHWPLDSLSTKHLQALTQPVNIVWLHLNPLQAKLIPRRGKVLIGFPIVFAKFWGLRLSEKHRRLEAFRLFSDTIVPNELMRQCFMRRQSERLLPGVKRLFRPLPKCRIKRTDTVGELKSAAMDVSCILALKAKNLEKSLRAKVG
jgi:hypothetical protein